MRVSCKIEAHLYITNVNLKIVKQNLKLNPYMNYFERKL